MRGRRGFTLFELMLVIGVLSLAIAAITQVLVAGLRVSRSQMEQADMQANVRLTGLMLPLELREIGYDSNITTGAITSDIEVIGPTYLQFRAMRGLGVTCGTPTLNSFRIRKPAMGFRAPLLTDGFMLYVESDPNTWLDDQWVPLTVTDINYNSTCGADEAIELTTATPVMAPGVNMALSQYFVGGPVRYYERMAVVLYTETDGQPYLGARSLSLSEPGFRPVAGPLDPGIGLRFQYYNRAGVLLDPTATQPREVRAVDIQVVGLSRQPISLAGTVPIAKGVVATRTRVALRNTLRH